MIKLTKSGPILPRNLIKLMSRIKSLKKF